MSSVVLTCPKCLRQCRAGAGELLVRCPNPACNHPLDPRKDKVA